MLLRVLCLISCSFMLSCQTGQSVAQTSNILSIARQIAPAEFYNLSEITVSGTRFFILTRKKPVLTDVDFVAPVRAYWPQLQDRFRIPVKEAAIIDFDEAISGGPLKPYILGIFSSRQFSPDDQKRIQSTSGWQPLPSTEAYINEHYGVFENPKQAYVDDMIAHELGHLYFGFGVMSIPEKETDWWFPVGLGLLYDRLGWDIHYAKPSPLFADTAKRWKTFSQLNVDQRLVNPNTSQDQHYGLSRRQIYSHAKAWAFLQAVRSSVGPSTFDDRVRTYLQENAGGVFSYDHFLKTLGRDERLKVEIEENKFGVR